ncbi:short chain dehydrogenase family protein [Aspergillus niger]|uniref:Short chain dehydrogenase family protein n=1 Tax=Aspergillus niger TaxID=5061 RepID=A0A505IFN8_ASPNG|nr:short chain dehydrogenase family protein [Aspergillus niger]
MPGVPVVAGCLKSGAVLGPRHRWSLWIVGRWPAFFYRFRGSRPREPPFVGVSAGLDPPPEGRMPQPASACKGDSWPGLPACGPVPGGYSGAIGWSSVYSRCAGGVAVAGTSCALPE